MFQCFIEIIFCWLIHCIDISETYIQCNRTHLIFKFKLNFKITIKHTYSTPIWITGIESMDKILASQQNRFSVIQLYCSGSSYRVQIVPCLIICKVFQSDRGWSSKVIRNWNRTVKRDKMGYIENPTWHNMWNVSLNIFFL